MAAVCLRVVFLVGRDSDSTRRSIEAVCREPGVKAVGVLWDTAILPFRRRVRNLFRNTRANGWTYPLWRVVEAIRSRTDEAVEKTAVSRPEVQRILRAAYPDRCFSLEDLGAKYGMPVHAVVNLNSAAAARVLEECAADLGVVLGTRILKPRTFSRPRMGCLNLHKGKVPEYRGLPPGFWELFDGAASAGVTVHFVDQGLDTGDMVATSSVPIARTETPGSLQEKLNGEGARLIASAVAAVRDGVARRQPQEKLSVRPRTSPTRAERNELRRRLPHWREPGDLPQIARNLYLLAVYYCGLYAVVRQFHRLRRRSRGAVYLYHRVNDYSKDVLTVDTRTFAAQLLAIARRYPFLPTSELVDRIRNGQTLPPTTVVVHFDDGYRDTVANGAPVLHALGIPACAFVSSGFVDTDRRFAHDAAKYPFAYETCRSSDVRTWTGLGLEVGAHTVNHVDLGSCTEEAATYEIVESGRTLRSITGKAVDVFSFPFGRVENISRSARKIIESSGYRALFATHGGFVGPRTDRYDIPRMGLSAEASPLYCLLQIEGLALGQVAAAVRRLLGFRPPSATSADKTSDSGAGSLRERIPLPGPRS